MNISRIIIVLTVFVAVIQGCSTGGENSGNASEYIALDSLIGARVEALGQQKLTLTKNVRYEDTTILTVIDSPDLKKELAPFLQVNVPEVSWKNNYAYRHDTVGDKTVDLFVTMDSSIDLKRFVIHRSMDGAVKEIHLNYNSSGMLSESDQMLIWEETDGGVLYRIEGQQHTRFFGEEIYKIEGKISTKTE